MAVKKLFLFSAILIIQSLVANAADLADLKPTESLNTIKSGNPSAADLYIQIDKSCRDAAINHTQISFKSILEDLGNLDPTLEARARAKIDRVCPSATADLSKSTRQPMGSI